MKISRRSFVVGSIASLTANSGCLSKIFPAAKWYKGNLHMHTFWSDGKAFPEEAIEMYKKAGYNFISLSDHNVFQEGSRWCTIKSQDEAALQRFLKSHPGQETRVTTKGTKQIKLSTFDNLSTRYNEEGQFKLFKGVESTSRTLTPEKTGHHIHLNYINIGKVLNHCNTTTIIKQHNGLSVQSVIKNVADEVAQYSKENNCSSLLMLNHPIWMWYDISPVDLVEASQIRFFELCNGGAMFKPHKDLPADGFDTDRFWDVVNAFRAKRGQELLLGVGSDDTHYYFDETIKKVVPFNAWVKVRASSLKEDDVLGAMQKADFMTCQGIEFDDINFNRSDKTLFVTLSAKNGKDVNVKFIVSKKGFSEKPIKTFDATPVETPKPDFKRKIQVFDEKIGVVVKQEICKEGQTHTFSYKMQDDDLYVRARIEQEGKPRVSWHMHPTNTLVAWTQPYL